MSGVEGVGSKVTASRVVELPRIQTEVGDLVICEKGLDLSWIPTRTYFLYDVPDGAMRGGHAHKELHQLIVAVSGSFDVLLKDGAGEKLVTLRSPQRGLLLPPGLWREILNFSGGSICLVLASHKYDEQDYFRDWNDFVIWKHHQSAG